MQLSRAQGTMADTVGSKIYLEVLNAAIVPEGESSGVGQLTPAPRVAADRAVKEGLPGRDARPGNCPAARDVLVPRAAVHLA